ncbi:hypothetical protein BD779DRAFT_1671629 [Infundibulicybe gibba]|nr:hypothetical protein BD779DRAFT_1671629 [Infundibulicybe gibba]
MMRKNMDWSIRAPRYHCGMPFQATGCAAVVFYGKSGAPSKASWVWSPPLPHNGSSTSSVQPLDSSVSTPTSSTEGGPGTSDGSNNWRAALDGTSTALALLKEVAGMFSNVPYIQAVAGVITRIIEIVDQVKSNKGRCVELVDKVKAYARIVFKALQRIGTSLEHSLVEELKEDLSDIARVLESILGILQATFASTKSARFTRLLKPDDILRGIEEQDRRLDTCITAFQLKASIVLRTGTSLGAPLPPLDQPARRAHRLHLKPQIMHGRNEEVNAIVGALSQQADTGVSIAVLGPGGIGKTSIALVVMHDDRICSKYRDNRIFISCEAATSTDLVISDLALALRVSLEGVREPMHAISAQLRKAPHLIILDNFETPWDLPNVRPDVENMLADITGIETTSVLITARGSQYPAGVKWTRLLPPVGPVDLDSAMTIFREISGKMDEHAVKLLKAVDCVPLAITLLANLAAVDGETTEALWRRWGGESTGMLEDGPESRLGSLEYSVRLSLSSPRMRRNPDALAFLRVLSLLPDGMYPSTVVACEKVLPGVGNVNRAISTLLQNALVVMDPHNSLRVLSPIRLFIRARYPPTPDARSFLQDYYISLASQGSVSDPDIRAQLTQEVGNIEAMLVDALHFGARIGQVIEATLNFAHYTYTSGVGSTNVIALAAETLGALQSKNSSTETSILPLLASPIAHAQLGRFRFRWAKAPFKSLNIDPLKTLRADCFGCWGQLLSRQHQFQQAEEKYTSAIQLHAQCGDVSGQAYDLHNLACLYMRQLGALEKAKATFVEAMALHEQINDQAGKAHDLMGIGQFHLQRSESKLAKAIFLEALSVYGILKDDSGRASALDNLGHVSLAQSQFGDSEAYHTEALSLHRTSGNVVGQAGSLAGLASALLLRSRFSEARVMIDKAIALRSPICDAGHLHILGRILIAQSKNEDALRFLNRADELHAEAGDQLGRAEDAHYLARIYLQQPGSSSEAERMAKTSLRCYKEAGNTLGQGNACSTLAQMDIRRNDNSGAVQWLNRALQLHHKTNCLVGQATDHYLMGCVQIRMARFRDALASFNQALDLHSTMGDRRGEANDKNRIAEALFRLGDTNAAMIAVGEALAMHIQINDICGQGDDFYVQGCIHLERSQLPESEKMLRQAHKLHTEVGMAFHQGLDLASLSSALMEQFFLDPLWDQVPVEVREDIEALKCLDQAITLLESTSGAGDAFRCKVYREEMRQRMRPPEIASDFDSDEEVIN